MRSIQNTQVTNITSNSYLCVYDKLTTQITILMNLHLHTFEWLSEVS